MARPRIYTPEERAARDKATKPRRQADYIRRLREGREDAERLRAAINEALDVAKNNYAEAIQIIAEAVQDG